MVQAGHSRLGRESRQADIVPGAKQIVSYQLAWCFETMHQRRTGMDKLADGVAMPPARLGTLDEFFEMLARGKLDL